MTAPLDAPSPAARQRPPSWWRHAYASVTPAGFFVLLGMALVFSISRTVQDVLVSIRGGEGLLWLAGTGQDFAGQALMVLVMVAVIAPVMSIGPASGWQRALALLLAVVGAALLGALVRIVQVDLTMDPQPWPTLLFKYLARFAVRYGYLAALVVAVAEFYRHEVSSLAAMRRAEVDRLALDREMSAARLQALQAQIEPHFLFNTLANVRRLYHTDPAIGREMLDNLMRYLEVALPRMRDATSTLAREATLIEAYLNVQQIRMGHRLVFEIDIPTALHALQVPPLMLLTLVENALKHGLAPLREGGLVRISAAMAVDGLTLTVTDTGRGFGEGASGGGTGLANIRARLAAMFGDAASLNLWSNAPRGVVATLRLPAQPESPV